MDYALYAQDAQELTLRARYVSYHYTYMTPVDSCFASPGNILQAAAMTSTELGQLIKRANVVVTHGLPLYEPPVSLNGNRPEWLQVSILTQPLAKIYSDLERLAESNLLANQGFGHISADHVISFDQLVLACMDSYLNSAEINPSSDSRLALERILKSYSPQPFSRYLNPLHLGRRSTASYFACAEQAGLDTISRTALWEAKTQGATVDYIADKYNLTSKAAKSLIERSQLALADATIFLCQQNLIQL